MLIELILALLCGILAGTLSGLIPGIHINLVGALLISLSASLLISISPIYLVVFISSMAITHTFLDFIPSILLGCPDTDTALSILPGHELLKKGLGYEAVMLTAYGSFAAIIVLVIVFFPALKLLPPFYSAIEKFIPYILILASLLLIFLEKKKLSALFVLLITGVLGLIILNLDMKEPLLPLLTGLFGSSMLILSIKNKTKIPQQKITSPSKSNLIKPILGAALASPICCFLPGMGSGQAAVIGNLISRTDRKGFLVLLGATNIIGMGFSFISLYAISRTRTGAALAIKELMGTLPFETLILILITLIISGIASFYLTKKLAEFFSNKINKINYTVLSLATLILLVIIVTSISGFLGLFCLIISTLTGILCLSFNVKRVNMMGCLLIPVIIFYLF